MHTDDHREREFRAELFAVFELNHNDVVRFNLRWIEGGWWEIETRSILTENQADAVLEVIKKYHLVAQEQEPSA